MYNKTGEYNYNENIEFRMETPEKKEELLKELQNFIGANSNLSPQLEITITDNPVDNDKNPIDDPDSFSVKEFFSWSNYEKVAYKFLKESLAESSSIFPHTSLVDLFSSELLHGKDSQYNKYKFLAYHVDFTIFDEEFHPILSIEIQGPGHSNRNDEKKKALFKAMQIPLLIVDAQECSKETMLIRLEYKLKHLPLLTCCWTSKSVMCCDENNTFASNSGETLLFRCKKGQECMTCKKNKTCEKPHIPIKPIFQLDQIKIQELMKYHGFKEACEWE